MIVFRVSVGVGFLGYALLLLEFTGLGLLLAPILGPAMPLTGGSVGHGSLREMQCTATWGRGWACPGRAATARPLFSCRLSTHTTVFITPSCRPIPCPPAAIWYGLYYGILTRDSAEVASDRIARSLGAGRKLAVSVRSCGICSGELQDGGGPLGGGGSGAGGSSSGGGHGSGSGLCTIQLSCKHLFHMECIR
jgi:hypothetical protein